MAVHDKSNFLSCSFGFVSIIAREHPRLTRMTQINRRWNGYPGARVDSEVPIYQLSITEVYNTWTFTTNYLGCRELQAHFGHVDKVCNLRKDTAFKTVVTSAEFDQNAGKWTVRTARWAYREDEIPHHCCWVRCQSLYLRLQGDGQV